MRVFLDFEASSLADDSYPIEVGWVFEDGRSESYLIRPAPQWTDWDPVAEAIHRIGRDRLRREGVDHAAVARRMFDTLAGHALYASAPSWDGKWLSVLLRAAGLPRHGLRLRPSNEAHLETAEEILAADGRGGDVKAEAADLVRRARAAMRSQPAPHRALADAEAEHAFWLEIGRLAREAAARPDLH